MLRHLAIAALLTLGCDNRNASAQESRPTPTRMILKESNLSDACNETRVFEDPVEHTVCYEVSNRFGCGERTIALSCLRQFEIK